MKKMTRILTGVLCAAVMGASMGAFAGCGGGRETITITGSTSVEAIMGSLAAEYEKSHDVRINITSNGSGTGIKDTLADRNDFGMSSRALKESEINSGLTGTNLCLDGIAVVVKKDSAAEKADNDQLFALYTAGTPFEDNGATLSTPVGREAGSGTRDAFDENIKSPADGKDIKKLEIGYWKDANALSSTGLVINTVSSSNTAVGYVSLGSYLANTDILKALKIKSYKQEEYVEATTENVLNGKYKLQRPFVLVTKNGKELSAAAKAFYDWLFTSDAQRIISSQGYVLLDK